MQDLAADHRAGKPSVLQLFGLSQAIEHHLDRSTRDAGSIIEWGLAERDEWLAAERLSRPSSSRCSASPPGAINQCGAPRCSACRQGAARRGRRPVVDRDFGRWNRTCQNAGTDRRGNRQHEDPGATDSARFTIGPGHNNRGHRGPRGAALTPHDAGSIEERRNEGSDRRGRPLHRSYLHEGSMQPCRNAKL